MSYFRVDGLSAYDIGLPMDSNYIKSENRSNHDNISHVLNEQIPFTEK